MDLSWIGLFNAYVVIGIIFNIYPIFATESLNITKTGVGMLLFTGASATTIMFVLLGRVNFRHFNKNFMIANQILLIFAVVLLSIFMRFRTPETVMILLGLFFAVNYNANIFHGVSCIFRRATRMETHEALLTAGMVGGSAAGGTVYQSFSMQIPVLFCAGLIAFGVFIQILLIKKFHM